MRVHLLTRTDAGLSFRVKVGDGFQNTTLDIGLAFATSEDVGEEATARVSEWTDIGGGFEIDLEAGSVIVAYVGEGHVSGVVPDAPIRVIFDLHGVQTDGFPYSCLGSVLLTE